MTCRAGSSAPWPSSATWASSPGWCSSAGGSHVLPAPALHLSADAGGDAPRGTVAPRLADGLAGLGRGDVPLPDPGRPAPGTGRRECGLPDPGAAGVAEFLLAARRGAIRP